MTTMNIVPATPKNVVPAGRKASPPKVEDHRCITPALIARVAYGLWRLDGSPETALAKYWVQAEQELRRS